MILTLLQSPEALDAILSPAEVELIRDALAIIRPESGRAVALAARLEAELTGALDVIEARRAKRAGGAS